jgi:cytidylate kinase
MNQQLIISVGREFGSGGHEIAQKLSKIYNIPLYDHNLLDEVTSKRNLNHEDLKEFDESKRNKLFSRTVKGLTNSPAHNVANLQFDYLKEKAKNGESFVVVGRCSETILKEYPGLVSLFILGDSEVKTERIMKLYNKSKSDAKDLMKEKDNKRKAYHNSHCEGKWGDSRNYDLSINSSKLGIDESVKIITDYINARIAHINI